MALGNPLGALGAARAHLRTDQEGTDPFVAPALMYPQFEVLYMSNPGVGGRVGLRRQIKALIS